MTAKPSRTSIVGALLAILSNCAMAAAPVGQPVPPTASSEPAPAASSVRPQRIKPAGAPAKAMAKESRRNQAPAARPAAVPETPKTEPIDLGCTSSE